PAAARDLSSLATPTSIRLVSEVFEPRAGLAGGGPGLGGGAVGDVGGADHLGDQLVDLDVPLHLADRDDGGLLAGVDFDDAAGAAAAGPGGDHAGPRLEAGAGPRAPGA